MAKIMVVTGEVSGDINAARVVRELSNWHQRLSFWHSSSALEKKGWRSFDHRNQYWFTEALKNLNVHLANLKTLKKVIDKKNRMPSSWWIMRNLIC